MNIRCFSHLLIHELFITHSEYGIIIAVNLHNLEGGNSKSAIGNLLTITGNILCNITGVGRPHI